MGSAAVKVVEAPQRVATLTAKRGPSGHGRHRLDQPEVRGLVLGDGACPPLHGEACQPAGRVPALAGGADARGAHDHPDGRERRGDQLRAVRPGRHRGRDRDERPAVPDEGDPRRAEAAGVLHRRRRAPGDGPGRLLRGPGRRDLHRRGRGDLAPVPGRVEAQAPPVSLRAGREVGHEQGPDAPVRPPQDAALRLREPPVLPRLPVPVRVLRHHRHVRPPPPAQDVRRRSSRRSTRSGPRRCGSSSSSTTT